MLALLVAGAVEVLPVALVGWLLVVVVVVVVGLVSALLPGCGRRLSSSWADRSPGRCGGREISGALGRTGFSGLDHQH